jgi:hypothetical protein
MRTENYEANWCFDDCPDFRRMHECANRSGSGDATGCGRAGPYGKEQICGKVNEAIQTGGTVRWADLVVADEAWEEQVCLLPEVSVSHAERLEACRHYLVESTVGSAAHREPRTLDLQDEVHPRAWVLASTGGLNGVRCRIGSWEYWF